MYQCYYDASYYADTQSGVAGIYIEDELGQCVWTERLPFEGIKVSQQAEAFALHQVILRVNQFQQPIRLLGDCKTLIHGVWGGLPKFQAILDAMRQEKVACNQLVWIYREYNKAHELTQPLDQVPVRGLYEMDVVYALTTQAYEQYIATSQKKKAKPFELVEKKLNLHIEEAHCFHIHLDEVVVFFRYGFMIFTEQQQIRCVVKDVNNKNQYGYYQRYKDQLRRLYQQMQPVMNNQV